MRRVCRRGGALAAPSALRVAAVAWMGATYTSPAASLAAAVTTTTTTTTTAGAATAQRARRASAHGPRCETWWRPGSGASAPALFRPTRIDRIPPQLLRMIITGATALLQVFVVAYSQESEKVRRSERAGRSSDARQATTASQGLEREMAATEAVQILGLDRSFPELFSTVQQAEASSSARSSASSSLPLPPGKAREAARQNFDRMFALAVKEDNMFLAGKLSAAYRLCVDPTWDYTAAAAAADDDERGTSASDASAGQQTKGGPTP